MKETPKDVNDKLMKGVARHTKLGKFRICCAFGLHWLCPLPQRMHKGSGEKA